MWLTQKTSFFKIARHSLMEKKNTSLANKMKKTYYSNDRKQTFIWKIRHFWEDLFSEQQINYSC